MKNHLIYLTLTVLLLCLTKKATSQNWQSPCPRLFTYENTNEKGRWYGIVTLLSDSDLSGVWLRLIFDKPSIQLGNWFGQVDTTDNVEYLVKNRNHKLKAGTPYTLRFYIQYNDGEVPPKLLSFRLNAKVVCPEGVGTTAAPSIAPELQTSKTNGLAPVTPATVPQPVFSRPGGGFNVGDTNSSGDDDDFFPGDFGAFQKPGNNPGAKPTNFDIQCGTVVTRQSRVARSAQYYNRFPNSNYDYNNYNGQNNGLMAWTDALIKYVEGLGHVQNNNNPNNNNQNKNNLNNFNQNNRNQYSTVYNDPTGYQVQPRPLITHGQATHEGEFPWHAALYHARGIDLAYICGGSLISKFHVITVAHCVTKRKSATPLNPDNLVIYLGKYYLKRWSNPGVQDRQVGAIIPHPQYNANAYSNDIAILKLAKPAEFTDYVRPVCLWEGSDDINSVINKQGTVVGWGFDETGRVTEKLTQAKMPVVSKETCIYSFPDFFSRFTTAKTFCAGFRNGTSVCNGDSGGGMVFPRDPNSARPIWVLRGLVSISVALQNQFRCDATHYVVFTDAAKYSDWIRQALLQ